MTISVFGSSMPTPDAICWRVNASGNWQLTANDNVLPLEDSIFVNIYPRLIDIQWNVNDAAPQAILAVTDWLVHAKSITDMVVCLGYHFGAPNNEVYNTPNEAATRLREIAQYSDALPFIGTMRKRLMLERAYDGRPEIVDMVECWLQLGGELSPKDSETLWRLMSKALIFRHIANDDTFTYAHVGGNSLSAKVMGDGWSERVIGRRAEDCFSDQEYENGVCADYVPVMNRDEGRFHHLRAVINVPGRGPGWYNYERLTLPWTMPSGERVLMVFSEASQSLDIPFLSGPL